MTTKPKAALLPLYIKLYDDKLPEARPPLEVWMTDLVARLEAEGIAITVAPICRLESEVKAALATVMKDAPDVLMTLHLAYSPSLESVEPLAAVQAPLLLLDTTMDEDFGPAVDPARLLFNHGIHGVQDLASMLRRLGREFDLVAGHYASADFLKRTADVVRAAHAASTFLSTKVLRVGESFPGMGDFAVENDVLRKRFGIRVVQSEPADFGMAVSAIDDAAVDAEVARDAGRFEVLSDDETHRRSVKVGLGLRRYLESQGFNALSANFLAFNSGEGPVNTFPFLELSKAMERGIGYAGEGDVLTAALVGALVSAFPRSTFTEMFCPDWKGNSVLLSHMGEVNPAVLTGRPVVVKRAWPFSDAKEPAFLTGAMQPGPATLVNLAPGPDDEFTLIVAPVEVLEDGTHPDYRNLIRAWFRPNLPLPEFLEAYSRLGGTHHCALVLGHVTEAMCAFARGIGIEARVIGQ